MKISRALALALLLAGGCPPWYRDAERGGRVVLDEHRTATELAKARADRDAGHPARAAEILRGTVRRNPRASIDVWVALVEAELAAGDATTARAHARWKLARLDPQDPGAVRLRDALIRSLARDGLIAPALDLLDAQTLDAAVAYPELAAPLGELAAAVNQLGFPETARMRLGFWLASYGEPDHPILRAAREQVARALWAAAAKPDASPAVAALRKLPELIHTDLAAGSTESALISYAEARPFLPEAVATMLGAEIERTVSATGITALTPDVHSRAVAGDNALQRGDLAAAIASYRVVVLKAPWWAAARRNLAALIVAASPAR